MPTVRFTRASFLSLACMFVLALAVVVAPRVALAEDEVTVTFDLGYETTEEPPAPVTLFRNDRLSNPPEVSREGATFDGWYLNYNVFDRNRPFDNMVEEDITLTAHWILDEYKDVVYTTLSNDGKTLTYSYGNVNVLDGTHDVYELPEVFAASEESDSTYSHIYEGRAFPMGLMDGFDSNTVERVVFDASMSNWHPTGLQLAVIFNFAEWTEGGSTQPQSFASLREIEGLGNLDTSGVTSVCGFFEGFKSLRSVDLSDLDLSGVTTAASLFGGCESLESFYLPEDMSRCHNLNSMFWGSGIRDVDLSGTTFAPVIQDEVYNGTTGVSQMFMFCPNLRSVNLSSISFADSNPDYEMLFGESSLPKSITVGEGWHFYDHVDEYFGTNIPQPPVNDTFTGKWWKGPGTQAYTPAEMGALTDPDEIAGTWTWERRRYEVSFDLGYETEEQAPETAYVDLDGSIAELPTVSRDGYLFLGWADDNGFVYSPYKPTDDVTLVAQWSEYVPEPEPVRVDKVYMHRLYNPNSGEHFYTASTYERDHLVSVGWSYEGYAWGCPRTSRTPVYRLYNPVSGDNHHYTTSNHERKVLVEAGWTDEGIAWYGVDDSCKDGTEVNVLRAYNPYTITHKGTHNWTTSAYEQKTICDLGWRDEGVSFVAYPPVR